MTQRNELHEMIARKLCSDPGGEFLERMQETLRNMDEDDRTLIAASQHLAMLAVEHEEPLLHYAATAVLWLTGVLNTDEVFEVDDVREYAQFTWGTIQEAISEIVQDGLNSL